MDSSPSSFLDRLTRNAPAHNPRGGRGEQEEREDEGQVEAAVPVAREVRRAEAVSFLPFPTEAITLERGLTLLKVAAVVHFQDFNAEVLLNLTIPNLTANLAAAAAPPRERREHGAGSGGGAGGAAREREGPSSPCSPSVTPKSPLPDLRTRFFAGDWAAMDGLLSLAHPPSSPLSLPPTAAAATDTAATDTAPTDAAGGLPKCGRQHRRQQGGEAAAARQGAHTASPASNHMPLDGASGTPSFCASPGGTSALGHGGGRAGGAGGGYDIMAKLLARVCKVRSMAKLLARVCMVRSMAKLLARVCKVRSMAKLLARVCKVRSMAKLLARVCKVRSMAKLLARVCKVRSMAKLLALVCKLRSRCCLPAALSLNNSFSWQCAPPPLLPLPFSRYVEQRDEGAWPLFLGALDSPLR
ncbi:unnamed protein product [Closterium sp. Yama58-4]|nr:unnamed protein product [Closterium sp. Yama58-4]